jgi:hypothetical protein
LAIFAPSVMLNFFSWNCWNFILYLICRIRVLSVYVFSFARIQSLGIPAAISLLFFWVVCQTPFDGNSSGLSILYVSRLHNLRVVFPIYILCAFCTKILWAEEP